MSSIPAAKVVFVTSKTELRFSFNTAASRHPVFQYSQVLWSLQKGRFLCVYGQVKSPNKAQNLSATEGGRKILLN